MSVQPCLIPAGDVQVFCVAVHGGPRVVSVGASVYVRSGPTEASGAEGPAELRRRAAQAGDRCPAIHGRLRRGTKYWPMSPIFHSTVLICKVGGACFSPEAH
eukprot:scaffold628159_cov24-Prasinocladus_malaysianus.AAC.1